MCSRLIYRSIQKSVPTLICNRFLSFTQIQSATAAKLKENSSTNIEKPSTRANISSDETITSSSLDNVLDSSKNYSEKIQRIVDEISKLTLVEIMDLNELLKVNIWIY